MTVTGRLPIDFDSITYSQERLNEYFLSGCSTKRLVVVQKYGQERLELKNSYDLTIWETVCAFFGCGPASFRNVMQFCADRALSHKNLSKMIYVYNNQHASYKHVSETAWQVLDNDSPSLLMRALDQRNMEVLRTLKAAPWQSVRNVFISEENVATDLFFNLCRPSQLNLALLRPLLQIIERAPKEDRDIINGKVDNEGKTAAFHLLTQGSKLSPKMFNSLKEEVNRQDRDGRTPLLYLLTRSHDELNDIKAVLSLSPNLLLTDVNGRGLLAYLCDVRKHATENQEKTTTLIDAVKNLPVQQRQQLLNEFFSYRNEYNRSELLQCVYDDNLTKYLLLGKIQRTFDWKVDWYSEEEITSALSQVDNKNLWASILDRKAEK